MKVLFANPIFKHCKPILVLSHLLPNLLVGKPVFFLILSDNYTMSKLNDKLKSFHVLHTLDTNEMYI